LTQLDKLKERQNVLVMTTSNLSETIGALLLFSIYYAECLPIPDPAFVDRADIKEYVGNPPPQAIYWILSGCIEELVKRQLAADTRLLTWEELEVKRKEVARRRCDGRPVDKRTEASMKLADMAIKCCVSHQKGPL
jgi:hypothetical protein